MNLKDTRSVWLEIDLDNIIENYQNIRKIVDEKSMIMAVIKANAYGHGSVEVARQLKKNGADRMAVSIITEAIELRKAGIEGPIQILNYTPKEQFGLVLDYDLIQGLYTLNDAKALSTEAVARGKIAKVHIKIDTGMGRIGFIPNDKSLEDIVQVSKLPNIEIEGIFSHFARSDELDKGPSRKQYEKFQWLVRKLEDCGINIKLRHISNSGAIIDMPEYNLDMVRPGITLYGYYPSNEVNKNNLKLKPAMALKGKISNIKIVPEGTGIGYGHRFITSRQSIIATVPIGYADGYSRMLSGKSHVFVKDKRVPIVGSICMDQIMIDITDVEGIQHGDEIVLFGYDNPLYPTVEELAGLLGTINYEFICMMERRIPRVYISKGKIIGIKDYLMSDTN
ncbi:alanine racemase [Tissierella creatinini]|nr:alanine racemase [Tissierella creatinini]TJX67414.1 alanine racemase [Soehngenia saccharolytica]